MKATPTEIEQEIERITEEIKAMAPTNKRYDQLIRQRNQLHIDLHQAKYPVHLQREPLDSIRTINK